MEADLVELAELNSGSRNLAGLEAVATWLCDKIEIPDARVESRSLPAVSELDDDGNEVTVQTGKALLWHCRPEAERRVLLAIHYDTVFAVDHPFQTCSRLSKTQLQGPGVADAKGGILVIREALAAIERFDLAKDLGWTILLNPDEEIGSPHSTALMQDIANDYDFGLLFEPSLPSGDLVADRGGSGNYTVVIEGKSAHVGRHFEDGRNAIARLSWLFTQLDAMNERDGLIVNVGFVRGGGPLNVVPDLAVGRFNVRVQCSSAVHWLDSRLVELYDSIRAMGYRVRTQGGVTSPPKPVTSAMQRLIAAIEDSTVALGDEKPGWVSTGGVCDGNKLAAAGLANIDSLGPVGGGLHSDQEWVDLPTIAKKAKLVVNLLHRYSRQDFEIK